LIPGPAQRSRTWSPGAGRAPRPRRPSRGSAG
jgi:hypothetical protein